MFGNPFLTTSISITRILADDLASHLDTQSANTIVLTIFVRAQTSPAQVIFGELSDSIATSCRLCGAGRRRPRASGREEHLFGLSDGRRPPTSCVRV